jgi:RNA polymerase sigma factor (sigma-70 family)
MTAEERGAAAKADPRRSAVAAASHPEGHRCLGPASVGPRAAMRTRTGPMRDDPAVIDLMARAGNGDELAWDALVERYIPLIWSICRRHRLGDANAEDVGQSVWLQLVDQLDRIRDPAALPGWLATVTRRECLRVLSAARPPPAAGYLLDAETIPDEQAEMIEQELAAERHAALSEAFQDLPPSGRRLILLLLEDPPALYAEISARLGIPIGSIGPTRRRCLDKLRRHPAIASLINTDQAAG